ncbi:hypothetical protein Moror_3924 [Moniliophthora roreri MCA 2997]|uniref:DOMON domain-containing protein n=2 Tax=Moniliophthora roreri TaxID=221103 RepID=V2XNH4_MONRO|nr:hypothetical protein Moror_3924 [Moniliophthora roreri MCA 2997]
MMWLSAILFLLVGSAMANLPEAQEVVNSLQCGDYMCVSGVTDGKTDHYYLTANGKIAPGWMAMGFGTGMANSPMVIIWHNADGSFTLSQREAPEHVMPHLVANPPRVATLDHSQTYWADAKSQFAFTVPSDGNLKPHIIWAISDTNPESSAQDAPIKWHVDKGVTHLELRKDKDA